METALAVLLTILAFVFMDDDVREEPEPAIRIECSVNSGEYKHNHLSDNP